MFEENCTYHIYNCANGSENLFREERNYEYFLEKYFHHTCAVAETYAYCLMPNRFHAMVSIRPEVQAIKNVPAETFSKYEAYGKFVSKQFSNLFSAYTQAVNKVYNRRGSLFRPNMKKKKVESDEYFTRLIMYIHNNPVKHGFVIDAWDWPHSSIHHFINKNGVELYKGPGFLESSAKEAVLNWFGNHQEFEKAHAGGVTMRSVFD